MRLLVDDLATEKVIAPALEAIVGGVSEHDASSGARIANAMSVPVDRAGACGDIRSDIAAEVSLPPFEVRKPDNDWIFSERNHVAVGGRRPLGSDRFITVAWLTARRLRPAKQSRDRAMI